MNVENFGTWAGLIWNELNANGTQTVAKIKKATELKDKEVFAALGWLAREGKVNLTEEGKNLVVTLIG